MEKELIIRIVLDVLILTLGLILILWKSYFKEKGKNLATKEDIELITKKIETVKNEINITAQKRLQYISEKKMAGLDFLNSISVWIDFALQPLSLIYNNPIDKELLSRIVHDLKEKGATASSNYWNLFVYYDHEKFSKIVDNLYNSCLELHNLTNKLIIDIERKAIEANNKREIFELVKDRNEKKEINKSLKELNDEINELLKKYVEDKKKLEEDVRVHRYVYVALLNKMFKVKIPAHNKPHNS